jgi:hypothetical protein
MDISGGTKIIIGFVAGLIILLLFTMFITYRRRNNIIKMGWLVNGTVIDIVKHRGHKADYYVSTIEYMHHKLGKTRAQRFSSRLPRHYTKGGAVNLYYHTDKAGKIELQNDTTTKVAMYILGILALGVLIAGISGIRAFLNHAST